MPTLKEEWKERLKKVKQRNIHPSGGGYFTTMTDFYEVPDEIRYDKEMCLQVLLEANECIWNIPESLRTNEFLEEIVEKGYKGNILKSKKYWEESDFPFLKRHLAKFEKKNKPKFDDWLFGEPKGIFANRDMLLSLIQEDNYDNVEYLLKHYKKDKELLCALVESHPDKIMEMPKSIKNSYCKEKENIYKILNHNKSLYQFLPDKVRAMSEIIDYQLSHKETVFYYLPEDVINDRERIFEIIKKYEHIKGSDIPYIYRSDFEIAKYLIERDGRNFSDFDFRNNDELIRLGTKTYNNVAYIPNNDEYKELKREVTLKSDIKENAQNYSSQWGNIPKMHYIKDLIHGLLKNKQMSEKTASEFFNSMVMINGENKSNITQEKTLLLEIIKDFPVVYEYLSEYKVEGHFDLTHNYIESCKTQGKDYIKAMSFRIKTDSKAMGVDMDKYVLSQYLANKLPEVAKSKVKKI